MSAERGPVFVERRTYRRRRIVDAARLLPVIGVVMVCLPLLWIGGAPTTTTYAMIYFFGLWLALVIAAALISRSLKGGDTEDDDGPRGDGEG